MQVTRNHLPSHADRMHDLERLTGILLSPEYIPHVHRMRAVERICIECVDLPALSGLPSPEKLSTLSISEVGFSGFNVMRLPLHELQLDYSSLGAKIYLPATLKSLVMYQCIIERPTPFAEVISSSSIESVTLFDSTLPVRVAQAVGSLASVKRIQLFNVPLSEGVLEAILCAPHLES